MRKILIYFLLLLISSGAEAQNIEMDALLSLGMEEVQVVRNGDVSYIAYEDNVYRGTYRGIAEVIKKLHSLPNAADEYRIVVLERGIPLLNVISPKNMNDLDISYDTDAVMERLKGVKRENRTAGKVDIILYPELFLQNSWFDKLYGVAVNLSPAIDVQLWRGASFTSQVIIPLYTNMTDEKQYVRPGFITLEQDVRLNKNFIGTFAIGNFDGNRMGMDAQVEYRSNNGYWGAGARAGLSGLSTFNGGEWSVSKWGKVTGEIWGSYYEPTYDLQLDLQLVRLVYGDMGARFDFNRHFGEVTVGIYAMHTGGEPNGGFTFAIPISRKKHSAHRRVNVRLPEYFGREYRAVHGGIDGTYWEKELGYSYKTGPDVNGSSGYDNPIYIKEQIKNLLKIKNK